MWCGNAVGEGGLCRAGPGQVGAHRQSGVSITHSISTGSLGKAQTCLHHIKVSLWEGSY